MPSTSHTGPGLQIIVGGYTPPLGSGVGVSSFRTTRADAETVELVAGTPVPLESASYLVKHPDLPWVYAISEAGPTTVMALRLGADGSLTGGAAVTGSGEGACHLCLDPTGRYLLVANYGSGSVSSFPVRPDGTLGAEASLLQFSGSGPDPERQEAPHAHQVVVQGSEIWVPDLGTDVIRRLRVDDEGLLTEAAAPIALPAGSGPRHLVVVDEHLVVACELTARLWLARRDGPGWTEVTTVPCSAVDTPERVYPSALVAEANLVFVANRGAGTVAVFELGTAASTLTARAELGCGGSWPRDLVVTPSHLWVANQTDDTVVAIARDDAGSRVDFQIPTPSPACILLVGPD